MKLRAGVSGLLNPIVHVVHKVTVDFGNPVDVDCGVRPSDATLFHQDDLPGHRVYLLYSVRMSTARSGQMMPSQAPQRGRGTSNAGIVVLDKTTGEELDIVPKNAARATLRCETNSS